MRCPTCPGPISCAQARQVCPEVPSLIITGYAEADAISDCPDGVEILLKPFTPSALEAAIGRICSGACGDLITAARVSLDP